MSGVDGLIAAFAQGMLPKVNWLREGAGTPKQASAVRASLTQELRKLCDGLSPDPLRPMVSRRAAAAAETLGVDLCAQTWASQLAFDRGRSVFHLEHVVPVAAIRANVLASSDVAQIIEVLKDLRLAWILKEENVALEGLGYRSRRPDPDAAYQHADIELMTCHPT